jgi:transposase
VLANRHEADWRDDGGMTKIVSPANNRLMTIATLFGERPGYVIDAIQQQADEVIILAHMNTPKALCPTCGHVSTRIHSYYIRCPRDLPVGECRVALHLRVRRFRCLNATCVRQTFGERMPTFLAVYAQRTLRLTTTLHQIGLALGGEAGARLTHRLRMPTSAATLLRILRQQVDAQVGTPRVLGVDDFALRKGKTYGTLLLDLEQHRPIDLLPNRTATTLRHWLQTHRGIEVIVRDRSTEYARGASEGAPTAQQVADRWHLLQNLRQMLERLFTRMTGSLRHLPERAAQSPAPDGAATTRVVSFWRTHGEAASSQARRQQRLQRYTEVQRLRQAGHNILQITRLLGLAAGTVRKYFYAISFPERAQRAPRASMLDPYLPYLHKRQQAGCENAQQLWRELRDQGYPGTRKQVERWLQQRRTQPAPTTPRTIRHAQQHQPPRQPGQPQRILPSPKQLAWLFIQDRAQLTPAETALLHQLCQHPDLQTSYPLVQQFVFMVRQHAAAQLDDWLAACAATQVASLQTFAAGIQQDYAAVRAALATNWSNGQTEGQVNRLKLIKRQMYGRASFDLLRLRVLAA